MNGDNDKLTGRPLGRPFGPRNRGKPGRRKGARNMATIVQVIAYERHKLKGNGKTQTFTTAELLIKALIAKSMEGDISAHSYLERLRAQFTPQTDNAGCLVVPETMTEEQWARYVEAHNRVVELKLTREENNNS